MRPLLVALVLMLAAGCGGAKAAPAKVVTKTVTPSPSSSLNVDTGKREEIFMRLVREEHYRQLEGVTDKTLLKLGNAICGLVPVDATTQQKLLALKALLRNGFKASMAGEMMGYASALCPEKADALDIAS